jgi:hypothetical protein
VIAKTNGSNYSLQLPTALNCKGRVYVVKNTGDASIVTLDGDGNELIDAGLTVNIDNNKYVKIISDGTQWYIIGQN